MKNTTILIVLVLLVSGMVFGLEEKSSILPGTVPYLSSKLKAGQVQVDGVTFNLGKDKKGDNYKKISAKSFLAKFPIWNNVIEDASTITVVSSDGTSYIIFGYGRNGILNAIACKGFEENFKEVIKLPNLKYSSRSGIINVYETPDSYYEIETHTTGYPFRAEAGGTKW